MLREEALSQLRAAQEALEGGATAERLPPQSTSRALQLQPAVTATLSSENVSLNAEVEELSAMLRDKGAQVANLNAKLRTFSRVVTPGSRGSPGHGSLTRSSSAGSRSPASPQGLHATAVVDHTASSSPPSRMQRRLLGLTDTTDAGAGAGSGDSPPPASPTVTSHDVAAAEALAMRAMGRGQSESDGDDGGGEMDVRAQLEMQSQIIALRRQLQTTRARGEEALGVHVNVRDQHDESERKEAIRTLSARARRARLGIAEDEL